MSKIHFQIIQQKAVLDRLSKCGQMSTITQSTERIPKSSCMVLPTFPIIFYYKNVKKKDSDKSTHMLISKIKLTATL